MHSQLFTLLLITALVSGCQSSGELAPISSLKPLTAEEGSLANQQLISDTTAELIASIEAPEITSHSKIIKFVIQKPVGSKGQRSWREMWVVDPDTANAKYLITFEETGKEVVGFSIQAFTSSQFSNNKQASFCPKNIAHFSVGVDTSDIIVSCLGKPSYKDYNSDGRYVFLYKRPKNVVFSYLFDKAGKLIKINAYKKSDAS